MFEHYCWCLALGYEVFVRCYSYIDVVLLHCLDVVLKYSVVFCSCGSGIGKKDNGNGYAQTLSSVFGRRQLSN